MSWQRWKIRGIFDEQGRIRHFQASGLDITDGKRAEEKLVAKHHELETLVRDHETEIRDLNKQLYHEISSREKADFYLQFTQFAMNNASYLIIWIDRDGRFIYMNKKAHEYLGYSYRELLTKNLFDFFPRDLKDAWDVKWETIRRERHVTFESMLKTGNGRDIPVEMVLNFLEFKEKPYCCCFIADITDRREVKRTLEEREKQYRILFEGAAEGILVADIATRRFLHANPAICRMLGYTEQEFLSMRVDDIHPAEDLAAVFAEFDAQVRGEKEVAAALPCLRKDKTILYADVVASPVLINGIHCLVGFFLDVTDRRNAQKALTRSRHELASIIDHLPDATFVINREGTVIAWNRAIETMTGVKAEDILGKGDHEYAIPFYGTRRSLLADIVLKPDSQMEARDYTLLHKEGDLLIAESNLPRLKGKDSSLWAKATPVYDENGEKIAAIESIRDITDRRNAEQALRESEARYRSLIENLPQRIFIKDKNSVYISCNNNYAADLKILPEEIAGMTDYDFYPRKLADKYRADDQRLIESGQTEEIVEEYQIQGEKTRVRTIKTPIRDVHGNRIGIIGIFWKVT